MRELQHKKVRDSQLTTNVLLIFLIQTRIPKNSPFSWVYFGLGLFWTDPKETQGVFFPPGTDQSLQAYGLIEESPSNKNGQDIESKALEIFKNISSTGQAWAHQTFLFAIFFRKKTSNPTSSDIGKKKAVASLAVVSLVDWWICVRVPESHFLKQGDALADSALDGHKKEIETRPDPSHEVGAQKKGFNSAKHRNSCSILDLFILLNIICTLFLSGQFIFGIKSV
ncbi:hypothetical protein ACJX0J_041290 [Zea mays]